jgi:hypothetical protein
MPNLRQLIFDMEATQQFSPILELKLLSSSRQVLFHFPFSCLHFMSFTLLSLSPLQLKNAMIKRRANTLRLESAQYKTQEHSVIIQRIFDLNRRGKLTIQCSCKNFPATQD